jgi:hypothetical protein
VRIFGKVVIFLIDERWIERRFEEEGIKEPGHKLSFKKNDRSMQDLSQCHCFSFPSPEVSFQFQNFPVSAPFMTS